jgi:uncharacterized protein (DUF433 family)
MQNKTSFDVRHSPAYGITEASTYLKIPRTTLASWVHGMPYGSSDDKRFFEPVLALPNPKIRSLSFLNLVEAHVLGTIRRQFQIPLPKIREAVAYLRAEFKSQHPLASEDFETNGQDLFVTKVEGFINVTSPGQYAIRELLNTSLKRIKRDDYGIPLRLYPFVRTHMSISENDPTIIVIDPFIAFGRPTIGDSGVPVDPIVERYRAGESIEELADDYGLEEQKIEEAIRTALVAA